MKILFVTQANGLDYLSDYVFHGLVSLGLDVTDSKHLWYLSGPLSKGQRSKLYGKGFTIAGCLPDRSEIDRSAVKERILSKEFDLVVYGSVWRCRDYLDDAAKVYPKGKIVLCDGEDRQAMRRDLFAKGLYFKRELASDEAIPVSFAVPEEKIAENPGFEKTRKTAFLYPGRRKTYIYDDELEYYKGYRESMFGVTFKKAGWDCMRHYEIAMNACLPYFPGIEKCPKQTMTNWPKELQLRVNDMY